MLKVTKIAKLVLRPLGVYLACWMLAYVLVNGDLDVATMVRYFGLAWTFNAFVRPAQTQIVSVGLFLLAEIVAFSFRKWVDRKKKLRRSIDEDS